MKFKTDFHSKMSVCKHELGVQLPTPAIPTLPHKWSTARRRSLPPRPATFSRLHESSCSVVLVVDSHLMSIQTVRCTVVMATYSRVLEDAVCAVRDGRVRVHEAAFRLRSTVFIR